LKTLAVHSLSQESADANKAQFRLKVARQLGYKSVKYLHRITVTDTVKNIGKGLGGSNPEAGYSWWGASEVIQETVANAVLPS